MGFKIISLTLERCDEMAERIKNIFDGVAAESVCGVVFCGTSDTLEYHKLLDEIKVD